MKRLALTTLIALASGILALLLLNALGFRPLNFEGRDPNSNAALVALLYFILAGVLLGIGSRPDRTPSSTTDYARRGYAAEQGQFASRFPYAMIFAVLGLLFIGLYFVLNRI
jgi:branched-subunit amino acid ABC-type transport system permease component